ncbi:MAG: SPW repeat protein [Rhodopseudomonas sp.]|uniref:SPW repeat domain-containing protein n=1 Tax=Rhodopseudomonas sp. TaxID=1078 RepID=UPI0017DDCD0F|nr:SPW repeat protein [Rhodopseudomonas sp.]NVN84979.1 SPW repeat protein [Rhodopseudomonas sp.]
MASIRFFGIHYGWEDCVSMALGAVILLTAWLTGSSDSDSHAVAANATIVGILVLALGAAELVDLRRWEEACEAACGAWLIASPFVFGYAGTVRLFHITLGVAVVLLAVLELRQDWNLSDAEFARKGGRR